MRCLSPRTVGFKSDGKTLAWSQKDHSKQFAKFQIACGKCIACRLESARQTAVRCIHEASLYEKNVFITLTYDDAHLGDGRLRYRDFQLFIKRLRERIRQEHVGDSDSRIKVFVAGEYGDKRKRPHWHALIFNWKPSDGVHKYTNDRGDLVYSSASLTDLWGQGLAEFGSVTFESAGYVARYASKKLSHGKDGSHPYTPISRRSSRGGIGSGWIRKYWKDVFSHGKLFLRVKGDIVQCGIPRYYEKWLQKNLPEQWKHYVTEVKPKIMKEAEEKESLITLEEKKENFKRRAIMGLDYVPQITRRESEGIILAQKFEKLQKNLKDV